LIHVNKKALRGLASIGCAGIGAGYGRREEARPASDDIHVSETLGAVEYIAASVRPKSWISSGLSVFIDRGGASGYFSARVL
jgi:hypothetical protein